MLQAAFGGYTLLTNNVEELVDDPNYYEPGYNLMSPLELSVPKSDSIYILIRKRDSSGTGFENNLAASHLSITATDATNGETLNVQAKNSTYEPWNDDPSSNTPVRLEIRNQLGSSSPVLRVRIIDCNVKDTRDNSFITFRIIVEEDPTELHFNYLPVNRVKYPDRNTFTASGRTVYMTLRSDSDAYILVSPYAWFIESDKDDFDFSYPSDTSYYKRESTFNNEGFSFSLQNLSHSFIEENISVVNVPGYRKVCLILIDNIIYKNIKAIKRSINFTVSVTGEISGIEDSFTVKLKI